MIREHVLSSVNNLVGDFVYKGLSLYVISHCASPVWRSIEDGTWRIVYYSLIIPLAEIVHTSVDEVVIENMKGIRDL